MLLFIRETGSRSRSVLFALFVVFSAVSIYAVNAAFSRTDSLRLSPVQVSVTPESSLPAEVKELEQQSLPLGFDRDTHTEYVAYGQSQLNLTLDTSTEIHSLKVFGAAPYDISVKALINGQWHDVDGLINLDLSSLTPFWHSYSVTGSVTTNQLQISFKSSTGGQATGLKELEIWGQTERVTVNTGANLLATIETDNAAPQARFYTATQTEAIIGDVENQTDQTSDNSFTVQLDRDPRSIKRAWLSYESHAAGHWVSVVRDVNGLGDLGGSYRFASSAWSGQLEQINPHWLVQGSNTITFKVIEDNSYRIRNLGLLVELDDGSNYIETISAFPVSDSNTALAAHDGNNLSGWAPYDGAAPKKAQRYLQLDFDKQVQLDGIAINLNNSLKGKIEVEFLENEQWLNAGIGAILGQDLVEGWNTIVVDRKVFIQGMKLVFENGTGSKAEIIEVAPVGSGVGATQSPARIDVTYPDAGQYYGDVAYIRGFVQPIDNGSGEAQVFVAGKEVTRSDAAFEALVNKTDFTVEENGYSVTVDARYPDGQKVSKKVYLTNALDGANASMQTYAVDGDIPNAEVTPSSSGARPKSEDCYNIEHDEGALKFCKAALDENESPKNIKISSLKDDDLPPLNPGMTNVTQGPRKGYRFYPHGKKFRENVEVIVPFDENSIPAGMSEQDIRTWYFDDELGRWVPLEKVNVDKKTKKVKSKTNHFTDMINATLTVPENPEAASFNPTQIKDIKAADPGAGINLIEPPQANNNGSANISYPIEIPAGRNGMQPQLGIQYNSSGGNGWLGLGWDLSVPSINIDTRWGVPRYDADKETETYMLNGQQLTPVAHRRELVNRAVNTTNYNGETVKIFHARVEGNFQKIIRHGTSPSSYWWEVINKDGTRNIYGGDGSAQHEGSIIGRTAAEHPGVFKWMLRKTIDTNGNTVTYSYDQNCDTGTGIGTCTASIKGKQLYLKDVRYTGHGDSEGKYSVEFIRDSARAGYIRDSSNTSYNPEIDRRPDVSINATGGFKHIVSERLARVNVKYDTQLIRSYKFNYSIRAFNKSLLSNVIQEDMSGNEFNRHEFDYHDTITQADKKLAMFSDATDMPAHTDNFALLGFPQTLVGGSLGVNGGFNGFFGIGPPWFGEDIHAAVTVKASASISQSNINLIDIDGDGLVDKVFERLGQVSYRKNISDINTGVLSFKGGEPQDISGINNLSFTESLSWGPGVKAQAFVATGYASKTNTATTDSVYFSDVNGDGLIDQVDNRTVKFGYRNSDNLPEFSSNSGKTIASIGAGNINAEVLLANMADERTKMEEDNPLLDAVRRWVVPYSGRINITGDVQLHNFKTDTTLSDADKAKRLKYETADGVRVSIQHNNTEIWAADINPDDPDKPNDYEAKSPAITYLEDVPALTQGRNVSKGQVIYFRVHSKYDGNYDRVSWSPKITYINASGGPLAHFDANQRNAYYYDATSDFVLAGRPGRVLVPNYGTLKIEGELKKSDITSDNVTLRIQLFEAGKDDNDEPILIPIDSQEFNETLNWNDVGSITLDHTMEEVKKGQSISIKIVSDSPIDLTKLEWLGSTKSPKLYYESAYEPEAHVKQPAYDSDQSASSELPSSADDVVPADPEDMPVDGGVLPRRDLPAEEVARLKFFASYDADIYPGTTEGSSPQQALNVEETGVLLITPWLVLKTYPDPSWICRWSNDCSPIVNAPDGQVIFTVKRNGELLAKQKLEIINKQVVASSQGYNALKAISVTAGDKLFFDFSVRNPRLQSELSSTRVFAGYGSKTGWKVPLTDTASFRANLMAGFPHDSENEPPPRPVIFIARLGTNIVEQKQIMINGDYSTYFHDFDLDIETNEKYYFDFFTIDSSIVIDSQNVRATYTGITPLTATKTGDISVYPKLNFTSSANGIVTLYISKNGQGWLQQNYTVVNSEISTEQPPIDLQVNEGDSIRFIYKTSDHVLSSSLADKGSVSINYVTQTQWKVPNNWGGSNNSVALTIQPQLAFDVNATSGEVDFRVWRYTGLENNNEKELIASTNFTVTNGQTQASNALPLNVVVNGGDILGIEYLTASPELTTSITVSDVTFSDTSHNASVPIVFNLTDIGYGSQAFEILMPSRGNLHVLKNSVQHYSIDSQLYGNPYRNWAYIAYNSDHKDVTSPTDPIKTSLLIPRTENDKKAIKDPETEHAYYLSIPSSASQRWESMDDNWWITGSEITSSRRGLDQINLPTAANFKNTSVIQRIPRRSTAKTFSSGGGAYFTVNFSDGISSGDLDLIDLNGDRYPDMVGGGRIQYTNALGEMSATLGALNASNVTRTDGQSYSIGPAPQDSSPGATGNGYKTGIRKPASSEKGSAPFSAGVDSGNSKAKNQLMDLNGDGLPDQVIRTDAGVSVKFNLGYDFAPEEPWGASEINHSATVGLSFGAISYTTNDGKQQLMDLNGDGLVDRVVADSDGQLRVNFNTGSGFGPLKIATGFIETAEFAPGGLDLPGHHVTLYDGASLSGSYGSGFSYAITIQPIVPLFDLVWGVGGSVGATVTQPTIGLRDMNGDGLVDGLRSVSDSDADVVVNRTGYTNMLKSVSRPLGGSFNIDYKRVGNTYELPQSMYVMSQVVMFDGTGSDTPDPDRNLGSDYKVFTYDYLNGNHDRFEREFLGFKSVIQNELNTAEIHAAQNDKLDNIFSTQRIQSLVKDKPTFRQASQSYLNDSFYTKGLLVESTTKGRINPDGSGDLGLYRKTTSKYILRPLGEGAGTELYDLSKPAQALALELYRDNGVSIFPYLHTSEQFFHEGGSKFKSTLTENDYDEYGNVSQFKDYGDEGDGDNVVATITYSHENGACESLGITGKPTSITVTDHGNNELRKREGDFNCADGTGNLREIRQYAEDNDTDIAITKMDVYDDFGNLKQITAPANEANHDITGSARSMVMKFYYDEQATNTYPVRVVNESYDLESTTIYDYKFGKPLCTMDTNGNPLRYRYDSFGRTTRIIGPYEQAEACNSSTDNGTVDTTTSGPFTIKFSYNPASNLTKDDAADISWAKTEHYNRDAARNPLDTIDTWLFTDGMKRVLQIKKTASIDTDGTVAPDRIVSGRISFDALGRSVRQYYPTLDGSAADAFNDGYDTYATRMTYDALDRNKSTILPDESETSINYGFGITNKKNYFTTTVIDAETKQKVSYRDVRELIHAVEEEGGIITRYAYDPLKQIRHVWDAQDNHTEVGYDLLGRRTFINNPDTGNTEYKYDLAGNLIEKITANRKDKDGIKYYYDYTRLIDISYPGFPDNKVHYVYGIDSDKAKNQAGRIKQVTHQSGTELREYGSLGETTREQFTVTAVRGGPEPTYITHYDFDTFGRLMKLQYPSGEELIHEYDNGGNLSKITGKFQGADYGYLETLTYDKFEQRVYMELGNGIKTRYTYREDNRRLEYLNSTGDVAGTFQNNKYTYDDVGNITLLENKVHIPRNSQPGGPTVQNFRYDDLHRLVYADGKFSPDQSRHHFYQLDMEYDNIHNITRKNQFHKYGRDLETARDQRQTTYDWAYGYDVQNESAKAGPHAPTSIDTRVFKYDANGNQTGWDSTVSGQKRNIIWDDENRIQEINDPGNTAWYAYDDQGQRKVKRGRYGETVYVNQFLTVRDGALATLHVYAGNSRVVSKLKAGKPIGRDKFNSALSTSTDTTTATATTSTDASSTTTSKTNNGNAYGHDKQSDKADKKAKKDHKEHPGQGLEHRSDRANEVAQNTVKNPHLIDSGTGDTGDGDTGGGDTGDTGGDTPLADIAYDFTGGAEFLYYYHPDHLGSTGYVTDKKGELYEHIEYFPFGETWIQEATSNWKVPYMYTGKELDEDTKLYYYGARYYDPRTSVWQSADPILGKYLPSGNKEQDQNLPGDGGVYDPINLGLYTYAGLNVLVIVDPDGNAKIVIDPGHGDVFKKWLDSGAPGIGGQPLHEKDQALILSKAIGKGLEEKGHVVAYTRTGDMNNKQKRFKWRTDISNNEKADAFISVHLNSFDKKKNHFMVGYISDKGKKIADSITSSVSQTGYSKSVSEKHKYRVLKLTKAPSILIEAGNIQNPNNQSVITSKDFIDQVVKGIDDAIK